MRPQVGKKRTNESATEYPTKRAKVTQSSIRKQTEVVQSLKAKISELEVQGCVLKMKVIPS